ncbi:MAG: DUF2786 domain-containing protein [Chitinophagales bacterium]|nr:DUF2786 domain-containing protein [Chitinophagales bacterium]
MQDIVEKIKKLRALATSSNEEEAATAAALAEKLIAKYRIEEAELNASNNIEETINIYTDPLYDTFRIIQWKNDLACILAKHYGCGIYVHSTKDTLRPSANKQSSYRLCGTQGDVAIVKFMFEWLVNKIEVLCKRNCKGKGHIASNSFCLGAVTGINYQLSLAYAEAKKEASSSALIILDSKWQKANDYMNTALELGKAKGSNKSKVDRSMYDNGYDAGKNINLGKGLPEKTSGKLLGN